MPDYVVRNPDQELWLQLVPALNFELTSTVTCFHAMVRHPQCENAVAAALLQQMRAPEFLSLPREDTQRFAASEMELIDAIIRRDGTKGFPSAGCGDAAWVNRAKLRSHLPEIRLLAVTPTGRPPRQRYIVDEDGVSRVV